MTVKKLIICIGAHKTGTTYFQRALESSIASLQKHKIDYIPQADYWPMMKKSFLQAENNIILGDNDPLTALSNSLKEYLLPLVKKSFAKSDFVVVSHEDFIGSTRLLRQKRLYPLFEAAIKSFASVFEEFDLEFCLTIRRQDQFIDSCILQQLQQGANIDVSKSYFELNLTDFSWVDKVESVKSIVGKKPILLAAEQVKISKKQQIKTFFKSLDLADAYDFIKIVETSGASNPSLSEQGLVIANSVRGKLEPKDWTKLRVFLRENFSSLDKKKATILPNSVSRLIVEYYKDENLGLLDKYGLNEVSEYYK